MLRSTLALLLGAGVLPAFAAAPQFYLPGDAVPTKHTIDMTIDPDRATFTGTARIDVRLLKPQATIWVNATDITVKEASVEIGGRKLAAKPVTELNEFLGLELEKPAGPGPATLVISYEAKLNEKPSVGAFRSSFEGNWYVYTSFTAIDARRAFPCFDEPRYKTPWQFTIHVKRTDRAFTNAKMLRETEEPDGMKAVVFEPTELLPSEITAFAVGPFETAEGPAAGARKVPVRVITPKGHAAEGKYAAGITADIVKRLETYTGVPYSFQKLDHISVPNLPFGATENAGLITYRSILVPPGPEPQRSPRGTMTHELAHHWFGDLVTQANWQEVWLSEGFATWLTSEVGDDEASPARRHIAAVAARERMMATDAGPRTRPVRLDFKDREGMRDVYSGFVYQKGAAVLLMLEGWMGQPQLRKGLRTYLARHRFANATTDDLARDLRSTTRTDTSAVLHTFLDQSGIPSVRADLRCQPSGGARIHFEQVNTAAQWTIPVCWKTDGGKSGCALMSTAGSTVTLPKAAACPAWIYWNAGGTGYYRSDWTPAQLSALAGKGLDKLTAAERLTLIYDLRAMKLGNLMEASAMDPLLEKLTADPEPEIAQAAKQALTGETPQQRPRR
jgi:alanyl aminopeptidase